MLILQGEQGSAKTTLARIPKIIVDPDRSSQEHEFLFLRQFGYRHRGRVVDTTALQEGPRRRETRAGKQLEALAHQGAGAARRHRVGPCQRAAR